MSTTESELIKSSKNGNSEAFGQLYELYVRKIYDFIYYKTHHKETAEDLTSQSFFKALEKINTFNSEKGSFNTWIYQIARNTVTDHYRSSKSNLNIDDIWDLHNDEDVERDTDTRLQLEKVHKLLNQLKPEQREILLLRLWNNFSFKEIAEIVGKSEANCKMIVHRTLGKLQTDFLIALILLFSQA
jgi:RNA polymerase sigma-70 factor (ECF subfamily)